MKKCKCGKDELLKNKERKKKKTVSAEWLSEEPEPAVVLRVLRGNLELGSLKASRIRLSLAEKVQSLDVRDITQGFECWVQVQHGNYFNSKSGCQVSCWDSGVGCSRGRMERRLEPHEAPLHGGGTVASKICLRVLELAFVLQTSPGRFYFQMIQL